MYDRTLVIFLPKIPHIHCICMVLASPNRHSSRCAQVNAPFMDQGSPFSEMDFGMDTTNIAEEAKRLMQSLAPPGGGNSSASDGKHAGHRHSPAAGGGSGSRTCVCMCVCMCVRVCACMHGGQLVFQVLTCVPRVLAKL